jgi:hypothetical protein
MFATPFGVHPYRCVSTIRGAVLTTLLGLTALLAVNTADAQETREYPPREYYLSFEYYKDGEFADAYRAFSTSSRSGIRSTEGRWVDSICYHTMMGECLYQMGELDKAVDQYTAALRLLMAHQSWMLRVDFPPAVDPLHRAIRQPTWGATGRRAVPGRFPDRYPILQGRFDNERVIAQGGVLALPEYYLINAHEIARCTALAIRRRRELMGEACRHDLLTTQVLQVLQLRPTQQNHWSQAWINVQLGMALAAAGRSEQAVNELGKGLLVGGTFDHPLTPLALLELGRLSFDQEQYPTAARFFLEASLSAAWFQQHDVIEESLRWGAITHQVSGQKGLYPPLDSAAAWARRESQYLEASLTVAAAENAAAANETSAAAALAEQARRRMIRTDMLVAAVGARLSYATALVNYQAGKLKAGDTAFAALMAYQQKSSQRLFEIGLIDSLFGTGAITDRVANELFSSVLREPTGRDWNVYPVETLSVLLTPHLMPLEHWLEVALMRREYELALEISDRIRRHRFYTTLPMGGRLLSLRWVLEGPDEALSEHARLQRSTLLERFPGYADLSDRSSAVRRQLAGKALRPDEEAAQREQTEWLTELAGISTAQEIILREIALHRAPAELAFPPALDFKQMQAAMPEGQIVLAFLTTGRNVYGFAFGRDSYGNPWKLSEPARIRKDIMVLMREMGHMDKNQPVDAELLERSEWKTVAGRLLEQITGGIRPEEWVDLKEVVIVPDGPLWYLPFEALPFPDGDSTVPLISKVKLRYVPTVSLAIPDRRGVSPVAETAIVSGQLFPRDDESVAEEAVSEMEAVLPRAVRLTEPLGVPSGLFSKICDRVVVLRDIDQQSRTAYDWSPLQLDRTKPGGALSNWMSLPWGGPQQIVLAGFHTPAEAGLKSGGSGSEIFLSACGLMASGARTILISRWRPGGQTSYDLVREFVQELPYTSATDAWQRSVELVTESDLIAEREPRLRATGLERPLNARHPFFWAGFALIDSSNAPVAGGEKMAEK